jgi:hypothetical protein
MALGAGLMSRFDLSTPTNTLLGLQVLFSVGAGIGSFQAYHLSVHSALREYLGTDDETMIWPAAVALADILGSQSDFP